MLVVGVHMSDRLVLLDNRRSLCSERIVVEEL